MKKVGNLTEARMVKPPEPKFHPLVSDNMFENKVKIKKVAKKLKGKVEEDSEVPNPDELPMGNTPEASKMTTNAPKRATKASVQVGGPFDLTASQKGKRQDEDDDEKRWDGHGDPPEGYEDKGEEIAPDGTSPLRRIVDVKDKDWIQGAEDDIERRGTKGKCTPITKKGCTGKAKALAKTFKKMAKRKKKVKSEGIQRLGRIQKSLEKKLDTAQAATWDPDAAKREKGQSDRAELAKLARDNAFKTGRKKRQQQDRAKKTAADPKTPLDVAVRAGDAIN